jgi:hypothetical protein
VSVDLVVYLDWISSVMSPGCCLGGGEGRGGSESVVGFL